MNKDIDMKHILKLLLISFLIVNISQCIAQRDIFKSVTLALSTADANQLCSFSMSKLSLKTPEYEGSYSKAQSEIILKSFFNNNKPSSFNINQRGNIDNKTEFIIGTLITSGGKYKVYILVKEISEEKYIHQLKFDKE